MAQCVSDRKILSDNRAPWILFSKISCLCQSFDLVLQLRAQDTKEEPKENKNGANENKVKERNTTKSVNYKSVQTQTNMKLDDSNTDSQEEKESTDTVDSQQIIPLLKNFSYKPPLGVQNLGGTCYFNGVIQIILSRTPELQWFNFSKLKKCMHQYYLSKKKSPVNLKSLMKQLNIKMATPQARRSKANKGIEGWNDPLNAYSAILEFLKQETGTERVNQYFQIIRKGSFRNKPYQRKASFLILSPTYQSRSIQQMLFKECHTSHCVLTFDKIPKLFVLSINRHEQMYGTINLNSIPVKFEEKFTLPEVLSSDEKINCELVGSVQYEVKGGHIVCFVKKSDQWYFCDDEEVEKVSGFKQISKSRTCLLIYKTSKESEKHDQQLQIRAPKNFETKTMNSPQNVQQKKPPSPNYFDNHSTACHYFYQFYQ